MSVSSHFGNFVFGCFGDKVTKKLHNSLFISLFHPALQTENIVQKITQLKWRKTKNELTKICDELGINVTMFIIAQSSTKFVICRYIQLSDFL